MQGTLNEIDIRSILQLIELGQRTGELFVEAYSHCASGASESAGARSRNMPGREAKLKEPGPFWFVFFHNGQIAYASDGTLSLSRLRDYLRRYRADTALNNLEVPAIDSINAPEYGYLWAMLENHILTPAQGRSIIRSMVHETLFDLLGLHQGAFIFDIGPALAPQLTTLEIAPLVTKIMKQVQEWKQFHPHIQSPDQCPVITDPAALGNALPHNAFNTLERQLDGKTSLRQLSRYLNRDILTVARAIYPYVQQGWVQLLNSTNDETIGAGFKPPRTKVGVGLKPDPTQETQVPRVVCIEDDVAIGKAVEYTLNQQGYEAVAINNPLQALSLVFQLKPDLILCDLAMPELDGYEICAMLRKSTAFRQTPIVMLTGKDGFIDRVRARMVGATDYLTKPFGESELLMLLEKYIGPGEKEVILPDSTYPSGLDREIEQTDVRAG